MVEVLKSKKLFYVSIWVSVYDSKTVFLQQCRMKDCWRCQCFPALFCYHIFGAYLHFVQWGIVRNISSLKKPHLKTVSVEPLGRAWPLRHNADNSVGVLLLNWAGVHILLQCFMLVLVQVNIYSAVLKLQPFTFLWSCSRRIIVSLFFAICWTCNAF